MGDKVRFNPRSRMGSDRSRTMISTALMCFNPRSRMGSDRLPWRGFPPCLVSIRAPAWGATMGRDLYPAYDTFQSALPHGERLGDLFHVLANALFQSALPHGERLQLHSRLRPLYGFNPRSRMGSDTLNVHCGHPPMFQSALPHGERLGRSWRASERSQVSIRAPAWGATAGEPGRFRGSAVSIRAPAWGATRTIYRLFQWVTVSIRAPAWGATGRGRAG